MPVIRQVKLEAGPQLKIVYWEIESPLIGEAEHFEKLQLSGVCLKLLPASSSFYFVKRYATTKMSTKLIRPSSATRCQGACFSDMLFDMVPYCKGKYK